MVGWFKIEGHSNPTHRKAFWAAKKRLKAGQRITGDNTASGGNYISYKNLSRIDKILKYKELISGVIVIIFLTIVGFLMLKSTPENGKSAVISKMEALQIQTTGRTEVISREARNLLRAQQLMEEDKYDRAYFFLIDNYRNGVLNPINYDLLYEISLERCNTDEAYCEGVKAWKAIADRLRNN